MRHTFAKVFSQFLSTLNSISDTISDSPAIVVSIGLVSLLILTLYGTRAESVFPSASPSQPNLNFTPSVPSSPELIDPLTSFFSNLLNQFISPDFHYAFLSLFVITFFVAFIYSVSYCFFKSLLAKLSSRRGSVERPLLSDREVPTDATEIREIRNNNPIHTEQPPVATILEAPFNPPVRLARRIFQRIAIRRPARRQNWLRRTDRGLGSSNNPSNGNSSD